MGRKVHPMKALYSVTPFKEIELSGTPLEWGALALALLENGLIIECESANPHPYQHAARMIRVEHRHGRRVEFQLSPEGTVVVKGDPQFLSVLAENAQAMESVEQDYHVHIEYVGDDHYVGPESMPVVFTLSLPALKGETC
jgi:hypothetical protein